MYKAYKKILHADQLGNFVCVCVKLAYFSQYFTTQIRDLPEDEGGVTVTCINTITLPSMKLLVRNFVHYNHIWDTVIVLSFWTDRSRQTV